MYKGTWVIVMKDKLWKGIIKENPVFVFLLGMCPSLATTKSIESALGMGLLVVAVLICSNVVISLLAKYIPNEIRIPSYIVIIATFVTIVKMLTDAFLPALAESLGVFIPLITVNCLILGRAESFASKNKPLDSAIDGLSYGLGYGFAIVVIACFREIIGTGAISYGNYFPLGVVGEIRLFSENYAINLLVQAPGAFICLGIILAFIAKMKDLKKEGEN